MLLQGNDHTQEPNESHRWLLSQSFLTNTDEIPIRRPPARTNRTTTISAKIMKRHSRRFATLCYRKLPTSTASSSVTAAARRSNNKDERSGAASTCARIPVFMLPHKDLATIPEDREIHEGFLVRMSVRPHRPDERRFSGLVSISDLDAPKLLEMSAVTTNVEFRSFSFPSAPHQTATPTAGAA